jgi:hypothetical protein
MNRRAVIFVVSMVVLTLLNFLWPAEPSPLVSSSFGRTGSAHGALYDLLFEQGLTAGRSFEAGRRLAGPGTIWWIDPIGVCDGRIARSGEVDVLDAEDVAWPVAGWLREGGVGVVFLQSAEPGGPVLGGQDELVECDAIAGVPLPARVRLEPDRSAGQGPSQGEGEEGGEGEGEEREGEKEKGRAEELPAAEPASPVIVAGQAVGAPRRLPLAAPHAFEESLDWAIAAEVERADVGTRPFVLLRSFGEGLLVVVADSGFTHNRWLDQDDSAPLAVDLVNAFGEPRFDEREHGLLPETSAIRYIASSSALPTFVGLAILGMVYAWRGNALPARSVSEFDPAVPTLETYVTSMTTLYAGTRDHSRVLERYRELTASKLKRHFGLAHEVSRRALAERIEGDPRSRRDARDEPEAAAQRRERLAGLVEPRPVATVAELEAAVRELDALVMEVTR